MIRLSIIFLVLRDGSVSTDTRSYSLKRRLTSIRLTDVGLYYEIKKTCRESDCFLSGVFSSSRGSVVSSLGTQDVKEQTLKHITLNSTCVNKPFKVPGRV